MQKSVLSLFHSVQQLYKSTQRQVMEINQYPLAHLGFYFCNQLGYYPIAFPPFFQQNDIIIKAQQQDSPKRGENRQGDLNNDATKDDNVKIQQKVQIFSDSMLWQNSGFKYFDPLEAPPLTFGMNNISILSKNIDLNLNLPSQKPDRNSKNQQSQNQQQQLSEGQIVQIQFRVNEPDPDLSPFLILKRRSIGKRKYLTLEEYEKRANEIQTQRIKNLHRMQVEQRIGKKLPVKNKKWRRKKPSLVFNSQQYKKKLVTSKKYKESSQKFSHLFFPLN